MEYIDDVTRAQPRFERPVLTIGSFDGVHRGHRAILERLVASAREMDGTAALMTIRPHPREFFSPEAAPNKLTTPAQQVALLEAAGLDALYVLPFSPEIASLDRQDFLRDIVLGRVGAQKIVAGHDFAFGKGAQGNYRYLAEVADRYGFAVEEVPPFVLDGERVSSTRIREAVVQGELDRVERFLGRKYAIQGVVERGRGMGHKLGFPTANIPPKNLAVPAHGVYAAEAVVDGETHVSAVNIGVAPTLQHSDRMIEAHLLDYSGDLVGKTVEIVFHKRLRPEKKYDSLDELMTAIDRDVRTVRAMFSGRF